MSEPVTVFVPDGALPSNATGSLIEASMRVLGERCGGDAKYGADFENDVFRIHPFCWCDRSDCPYCKEDGYEDYDFYINGWPNFLHKPTGFAVWWYKYIGRSMEIKGKISPEKMVQILEECLDSLK